MTTVFVIDDDADVSSSIEAVTLAMGHDCQTFESAESLLNHWDDSCCDCLIVDVDLPGIDGIELLRQLRAQGSTTPAVFYTGRCQDRLRHAVEFLEDVPVIQKGGTTDDIESCLKRLLQNTRHDRNHLRP